jgi:hypothetical protein
MFSGTLLSRRRTELASTLSTSNFFGLFNTVPLADGTGGTEVTNSGYARVANTSGIFQDPATQGTVSTRQSLSQTGTYVQASTLVTVTKSAHGYRNGQQVVVTNATGSPSTPTGTFTEITVVDANTFTYTTTNSQTASGNITFNETFHVFSVTNLLPITFPAATADLGTVKGVGIATGSTGANFIETGTLDVNKLYTNGDGITILAGGLTLERIASL